MSILKPRKPRSGTGSRGLSVRNLFRTIANRVVVAIKPMKKADTAYNTEAMVTGDDGLNRSYIFKRQDIAEIFAGLGIGKSKVAIAVASATSTPITVDALVKTLNGVYRCDFAENDLVLTNTSGNDYLVKASQDSLYYIGEDTLTLLAGATTTPTTPTPKPTLTEQPTPTQPQTPPEEKLAYRLVVALDSGLEIVKDFKELGTEFTNYLETQGVHYVEQAGVVTLTAIEDAIIPASFRIENLTSTLTNEVETQLGSGLSVTGSRFFKWVRPAKAKPTPTEQPVEPPKEDTPPTPPSDDEGTGVNPPQDGNDNTVTTPQPTTSKGFQITLDTLELGVVVETFATLEEAIPFLGQQLVTLTKVGDLLTVNVGEGVNSVEIRNLDVAGGTDYTVMFGESITLAKDTTSYSWFGTVPAAEEEDIPPAKEYEFVYTNLEGETTAKQTLTSDDAEALRVLESLGLVVVSSGNEFIVSIADDTNMLESLTIRSITSTSQEVVAGELDQSYRIGGENGVKEVNFDFVPETITFTPSNYTIIMTTIHGGSDTREAQTLTDESLIQWLSGFGLLVNNTPNSFALMSDSNNILTSLSVVRKDHPRNQRPVEAVIGSNYSMDNAEGVGNLVYNIERKVGDFKVEFIDIHGETTSYSSARLSDVGIVGAFEAYNITIKTTVGDNPQTDVFDIVSVGGGMSDMLNSIKLSNPAYDNGRELNYSSLSEVQGGYAVTNLFRGNQHIVIPINSRNPILRDDPVDGSDPVVVVPDPVSQPPVRYANVHIKIESPVQSVILDQNFEYAVDNNYLWWNDHMLQDALKQEGLTVITKDNQVYFYNTHFLPATIHTITITSDVFETAKEGNYSNVTWGEGYDARALLKESSKVIISGGGAIVQPPAETVIVQPDGPTLGGDPVLITSPGGVIFERQYRVIIKTSRETHQRDFTNLVIYPVFHPSDNAELSLPEPVKLNPDVLAFLAEHNLEGTVQDNIHGPFVTISNNGGRGRVTTANEVIIHELPPEADYLPVIPISELRLPFGSPYLESLGYVVVSYVEDGMVESHIEPPEGHVTPDAKALIVQVRGEGNVEHYRELVNDSTVAEVTEKLKAYNARFEYNSDEEIYDLVNFDFNDNEGVVTVYPATGLYGTIVKVDTFNRANTSDGDTVVTGGSSASIVNSVRIQEKSAAFVY